MSKRGRPATNSDAPHVKRYARSKAKLRDEVEVRKGREADLWDEVQRLRGLAVAVRLFLEEESKSPPEGKIWELEEAAAKARLFESGPGVQTQLAKERSDRVKRKTGSGEEPARSKDPLTERRYQEDQEVLRQDGRTNFETGDEVEPV